MRPTFGGLTLWLCAIGGLAAQEPAAEEQGAAPADRPIVGAIRWDAWYGEGSPASVVEKSLGPPKYHFRLPFFARVVGPDKVTINGDSQAVMEQEIAFAADAGLDYWAFVDYWDAPNLRIALDRYRAAQDKRGIRYCLIEEGHRLDRARHTGWPRLIEHFQDPHYLKVVDGRPLLYIFGRPQDLELADVERLDQLAVAAGLKKPYKVFMGWNPASDAAELPQLGFDAVSAYAAGAGYQWDQWPYEQLTRYVRTAYWEVCRREHLQMITFATSGWDPRPRVETPVPWISVTPHPDPTPPEEQQPLVDAVTATPDQLAQHLQDALTWTGENRQLNPANAVIIYGWNENDEGGWLIPTLLPDGRPDRSRIDALSRVLRRPDTALRSAPEDAPAPTP